MHSIHSKHSTHSALEFRLSSSGVTQDWLKTLTDENGDRIIQEEEPGTDALQQQTFDGVVAGDEYGRSVSSAGDVNGDGFDDVIIGAPKNNAGGISSGRAYIFSEVR
ncbi:MAG: FG-GAP repeat protein [Ignavibacteria bacterium]|nr:FG-GAP repeat protein [Ignavibacteria bacterium]